MLNYFKKLFTGYNRTYQTLNGQDYRFLYKGRKFYFDPVQMVNDLKTQINDPSLSIYSLDSEFTQVEKLIRLPDKALGPSVICEFEINDSLIKVIRITYNDGKHSISHYRFERDGLLLGSFFRKYDYGLSVEKMGLKMSKLLGIQIDLRQDKWLWKSKEGNFVLVEKFGHSQIWIASEEIFSLSMT